MNIHTITGIFMPYFRRNRAKLMMRIMPLMSATKILDVGGVPSFWNNIDFNGKIVSLNLYLPRVKYDSNRFECIIGDARDMIFEDKEFDIVFSNSVIEHVGDYEDQKKFAEEVRRTGVRYWVQTPNKWFFVEPHLVAFFVHWFPANLQQYLLRWFTVWGILQKPSKDEIREFLRTTRLLTVDEMKEIFPDAIILKEKFLFMTKSIIAYR